jgi:exonuclease III
LPSDPGRAASPVRSDLIYDRDRRNNSVGNDIKTRLEECGLFVATAVDQTAGSNGVLVASKAMIGAQRVTPKLSHKGELVLVNIDSKVRLLAAYFPQNKAKAPFFQSCMAEAAKSDQTPFLLLCDLNTGRNDLDIEGNGAPFYCADLFQALEGQVGLIDLWRAEHGMQREWTWRSQRNSFRTDHGFRIDHAFGNERFLDRYPSINCFYDHRPREIGITDHSALLLRYA